MSEAGETASGRRANKRAAVFRTIGEVAEDLDLPAHVLRFWESKFPQLKPLKRGGGRRYYRPEDVALLSRIRQCLYQEGYTIRGVQKLLADGTLEYRRRSRDRAKPLPARAACRVGPVMLPPVRAIPPARTRRAAHGARRYNRAGAASQRAFPMLARPSSKPPRKICSRRARCSTRCCKAVAGVSETCRVAPRAAPRRYDRAPRQRCPGRSVAQPGSASAWGAEGREFESLRSDQSLLLREAPR